MNAMLTCHGCMRHCLQSIIGDLAYLPSVARVPAQQLRYRTATQRRSYASPSTKLHDGELRAQLHRTSSHEVILAKPTRQEWLDSRGVRPADKPKPPNTKLAPATANAVRFWKKDPLKLAEWVREALRSDEFDTAVEVIRDASKDMQCVVSWNHLIDWQLSKGRMNGALKIYNEMKKRAQTPDAHTYTIIFRGCADHKDSTQALAKVMAIYQSMTLEKSPVKPNTIHLNAILKMCARAQDIDALMAVSTHMPEKGVRAANNLTFTTIVNALRMNAIVDQRGILTPIQKRANARQAIIQVHHIWQDITKRWRAGDIWIDEELVCAMGRMLLISDRKEDWDDVLSLIQQTMQIPRLLPRLGTSERALIEPASQVSHGQTRSPTTDEVRRDTADRARWRVLRHESREDSTNDVSTLSTSLDEELPSGVAIRTEGFVDSSPILEYGTETVDATVDVAESAELSYFDKVTPPDSPVRGASGYAKPSQNTLSLVLQALLKLESKAATTKYWNHFTKDLNVIPDRENYISYLRILRVARASTETVQLLLQMPGQDMEVKTLRIAMAACERDKNNQHSFANAGKVLDLMQAALKQPDIKVLCSYLEIALSSTVFSKHLGPSGKKEWWPLGQGQQIIRALHRLKPSFINIKSLLFFPEESSDKKGSQVQLELVQDTRHLVTRMVAAYNRLMDKELVSRELYGDLMQEKKKLDAFLSRHSMRQPRGAGSREQEPPQTRFRRVTVDT